MDKIIAVIGLGYVGLPLAILLSKKYQVIGYDVNKNRINELKKGIDVTNQIFDKKIIKKSLNYTFSPGLLKNCSIYIITVPTPLKKYNNPDFNSLKKASKVVSKYLTKGDIVVYESTVFPGATEEICVPILSKSGLKYNTDFTVGYSPERINVGDSINNIKNIPKIVSASNRSTLNLLFRLYKSVIAAKIHRVSSIKIAEAAKVIENSQRDVNIAFVNEIAMMLSFMGLDSTEVFEAAATKWNFLKFSPGLVGGHCIGIDPYYLAHKAKKFGYSPNLLLSARKVNEEVPNFITSEIIKKMKEHKIKVHGSKILLLGATFKENTADIRNSKALKIAYQLAKKKVKLIIYDPFLNCKSINNIETSNIHPKNKKFDVIILAVKHKQFKLLSPVNFLSKKGFVYDIKNLFKRHTRIYRM
tara:strand:+ start:11611 stop:12855 length:1245 start_codon:yes stop_codon:yes gene_type:complete